MIKMMNVNTKRIAPSLDNYTETVDEISAVLSEMKSCLDRHAEETAILKSMLFRLEQLLDTLTD